MGGNTWNYLMDPLSLTGWQQRQDSKKATEEMIAANQSAQAKVQETQKTATTQAAAAQSERRKRMLSGSQTIFTSPLGVGSTASVARKILLGQ